MSRDSTRAALGRFFAKEQKKREKEQGPSRKNDKPEFKLTKVPCMAWLELHGFSMDSIEAKAVFNVGAGRYMAGQTTPGVADAFGCTPCGVGCFVEFKAPGKRSTLKAHQRQWLLQKIKKGSFAVCVDSVENLEWHWKSYLALKDGSDRIKFLLNALPPEPNSRTGLTPASELPF